MNFERTNTKISLLEDYYSHFEEDKRLKSRHGQVEFITSMKYIHEVLNEDFSKKILVFVLSKFIISYLFIKTFLLFYRLEE